MAHREQLEQLKRLHGYERWRGRNRLPENLFVWRLRLEGSELPGWRTRRVQPITAPRMPRSTHSIWQPRDGDPDALLRIDVYECDSRDDAHQFLLRMLGEIETPLVQLRDEFGVGDVAFADPQDAVILFARANLAVRVANAGRKVIPVGPVAEQLDGYVAAKPDEVDEREAAGLVRAPRKRRAAKTGAEISLEVPRDDPDHVLVQKFFSPTGELRRRGGKLVYEATSPGKQEVSAFALQADRKIAHERVSLEGQ
jgi:hypothetical protein